MTLTELLVSMIVFSIAIGMVYSAVILTMQWSRETQQAADAVTELRQGLAQIDRQVRSGNVLFSPEDEDAWLTTCQDGGVGSNAGTCMRIFTQSNGDQKCVQWQIGPDPADATKRVLQTRSWETNWQTGGSVSAWNVVARDINFVMGTTPMPFTLEGASTPYKERMLRVHLEVMDERQNLPVEIDSSLTGRNTSYGYDSGQCEPVPGATVVVP
ncbi:type II secretion system protein [Actinotalea sp. Marseille-Q4924]|uniref:type II secretion system protein n=1 Tax=Actinotalea sp. Marseille-Q4924 TaxID=2866571 RepID=UPI001CE4411C|nr:type II secretion system protein [Actinotalea sp. Marseille-Q4924]